MKNSLRLCLLGIALCLSSLTIAQERASQPMDNILFIGNSYVEVNNLPLELYRVASSVGIEFQYQTNAPGGCTFQGHCNNASMGLIQQGGWDYVILQEQSQYPSFPLSQVQNEVFPFAKRLVDSVYKYSPCGIPMFYMTWGRKYGDSSNAAEYPPLGTYEGMDSLLYERYMMMKESNNAAVSPVGRVWHYIRDNYPSIELYQGDNSHPMMIGTYAAACSFLAAIWGVDPTTVTYVPSGLDATQAADVRTAAKVVVYDNLPQWRRKPADANFTYEVNDNLVQFNSPNSPGISYEWDFGDGITSTRGVEVHKYLATGTYAVTLVATNHCEADTLTQTIVVSTLSGIDNVETADIRIVVSSDNVLTVKANELIRNVRVFTIGGIEVLDAVVEANDFTISLPTCSAGVYVVKAVLRNGNETTQNIIIK